LVSLPASVLQSSAVPLGLAAVPMGGQPPAKKSLGFTVQHQRQTQWCWAAVTSSVATYYKSPSWTQCRLANLQLGQSSCCAGGSTAECNRPWFLDKALDQVGNLSEFTTAPLTLPQIVAELDAGRPIGVRIGWGGGGGHFVAIGGYSQDVVDVHDPWFGNSSIDYLAFRSRYQGNGRWTHSYRTTPKESQHAAPASQATRQRVSADRGGNQPAVDGGGVGRAGHQRQRSGQARRGTAPPGLHARQH
jgi:hypothetical protein